MKIIKNTISEFKEKLKNGFEITCQNCNSTLLIELSDLYIEKKEELDSKNEYFEESFVCAICPVCISTINCNKEIEQRIEMKKNNIIKNICIMEDKRC